MTERLFEKKLNERDIKWRGKTLAEMLEEIRKHDVDYNYRNDLVLDAFTLARWTGIPAGIRFDPTEPDWPVIFIELPGVGQVSWHIPQHTIAWDGHDTETKLWRLHTYSKEFLAAYTEIDERKNHDPA